MLCSRGDNGPMQHAPAITPPVVRNLFNHYPFKSVKMSLCLFPRVSLENLVALFLFSPLNMASSNIACHAELRKILATRYSDDRPVSKANAEIFWTQLGKRKYADKMPLD